MADKISASITYVDANNNKGSKAVTDISPTADNGAIKNFCVGLLGLTTNTLAQIDRVEKTDITNATTKPKLTVTLSTSEGAAPRFYDDKDERVTDAGRALLRLPTGMNQVPFSMKMNNPVANYFTVQFCYSSTNTGYVTGWWYWSYYGYEETTVATIDFYFEETETTAATNYRMTISKDPATWEQI